MRPIGHHVIMKLADGSVLAPTDRERRILARVLLEQGQDVGLTAFRVPDTHAHAEIECDRARAGQFAREVEIALSRRLRLQVPFERAYLKPIVDQNHGYGTFRYVLRQNRHHGVETDPFHEASNLPDLLGGRLLGRYTEANVRRLLPRIRREELLEIAGVPSLERAERDFRLLADSAAAALALADVAGRSNEATRARRAAAHLAVRDLSVREIAERLGSHPATVRRLLLDPPDEALVGAIDVQLRLRSSIVPRTLAVEPAA